MISVIIPVYNAEDAIGRCIESIIGQTNQDWELILVDDGSPDKSGKICDVYALKDSRIRVVHQNNEGPSSARNNGVNLATGEYFCFVDSDDYVEPNYLADFHLNDNYSFIIQGMRLTYLDGRTDEYTKPKQTISCTLKQALEDENLFYLLCGPCCKAFRTDIVRQHGINFPSNVKYGEDRIFVLKYMQYCTGKVFLNSVSNYVYTHENLNSLTSRRKASTELYQSSILQYRELNKLEREVKCLPQIYVDKYRKEIALDTYQAIYNSLIENKRSLRKSIFFIQLLDNKMLGFISTQRQLPKTFILIRMLIKIVRILK